MLLLFCQLVFLVSCIRPILAFKKTRHHSLHRTNLIVNVPCPNYDIQFGRKDSSMRSILLDETQLLRSHHKTFKELTTILSPVGSGQSFGGRALLHATNAKRPMTDLHMWTHIFFIINIFVSMTQQFYDMTLLLSITTPLSLFYHHAYEKPGALATAEGFFAKCLFLYGVIQLLYAPSTMIFTIEMILLMITVTVFVGTNIRRDIYDPWHSIMHIVPPLWATIITMNHHPLILLF